MRMIALLGATALVLGMAAAALPARAVPPSGAVAPAEALRFAAIGGGDLALEQWRGRPVLVVNTASRCGFTRQYDDMQALYDRYRDRGLVVLAVPSNDFRQELASDAEVAQFCEVNFSLDFPMTSITSVRGAQAHPFYQWLEREHGIVPGWNFTKVLIGGDGRLLGSWGSQVRPVSRSIRAAVEAALRG